MSFIQVALLIVAGLVGLVMLLRPRALLLGAGGSSEAVSLMRNIGLWLVIGTTLFLVVAFTGQ